MGAGIGWSPSQQVYAWTGRMYLIRSVFTTYKATDLCIISGMFYSVGLKGEERESTQKHNYILNWSLSLCFTTNTHHLMLPRFLIMMWVSHWSQTTQKPVKTSITGDFSSTFIGLQSVPRMWSTSRSDHEVRRSSKSSSITAAAQQA